LTAQRSIELEGLPDRVRLFGQYDRNLSAIESALKVRSTPTATVWWLPARLPTSTVRSAWFDGFYRLRWTALI
jgi:hypothetical protein